MSAASFLHSSFLQAVNAVMLWLELPITNIACTVIKLVIPVVYTNAEGGLFPLTHGLWLL